MCLYKKSRIPRIATKDIVVYKVLRAYKIEGKKEYQTIFKSSQVWMNSTFTGVFKDESFLGSLFSHIIYSGYIHSFTTLEKARIVKCLPEYCIAECIIPKGTLYWTGNSQDIASRKLRYNKIIYPELTCTSYTKIDKI